MRRIGDELFYAIGFTYSVWRFVATRIGGVSHSYLGSVMFFHFNCPRPLNGHVYGRSGDVVVGE